MNNIEYKIDSKESFDLIIIGNITKDYFNDSMDFQLGGPSLYAGITASKLGLKTLLISNHTINKSYFDNFTKIKENHAKTLRKMIKTAEREENNNVKDKEMISC